MSVALKLLFCKCVSSFIIMQSLAEPQEKPNKRVCSSETPASLTPNSLVNGILFSDKDKVKDVRG